MKLKKLLGLAPLQIAQALIGFGAIAAFTRLMSAEEFGRYALALSVSMFAHTLIFTWAEGAAYRFFAAARTEKKLSDHFATLLAVAIGLAVIALIATGALLWLFGLTGDTAALLAFAAGAAAFRFLTRMLRESERAAMQLGRFALAETAYLTLGFALGLAFLTKFDLGAAAPFAGLAVAGAVVFLFDAPRLFARAKGGVPTIGRARSYAGYGAPLALAIGVDLGVQAIARILLATQANEAQLGAFAAAFGLARPIDLIFMSAGAALTPMLLNAYEEHGEAAARDAAQRIFILLAAVTLPAAIGLMLLAEPLSHFLVGPALAAETARTLPWLALAGLFAGFNLYYWSEAFQLTRKTGQRAVIMLAPGALQIGLTFLLAGAHGAVGAAIAAAAAAITGGLLLSLIGAKRLALPLPIGELARIGAASAAMALVVIALPQMAGLAGLVAPVVAAMVTYGFTAIALNVFGARAPASAVLQSFVSKVRGFLHSSFTDDAHAPR